MCGLVVGDVSIRSLSEERKAGWRALLLEQWPSADQVKPLKNIAGHLPFGIMSTCITCPLAGCK